MTRETTLDEALDLYVRHNPRVTSRESVKRYRTTTNNFSRWLGRPATVRDLTRENYNDWVRHRQETRAPGTVRGEAEKLTTIWRWCEQELGGNLPPVLLPQPVETEPIAWTQDELERLEAAAARFPGRIGGVPGAVYWPAFIGVSIDTGERLAAIHAVCGADINLRRSLIHFRRETRKGKRRSSTKLLTKETVKKLAKLLELRPDQPFASVQPSSLYRPYTLLLASAGLPTDRVSKFHRNRRTHATWVHIQGGDATESCGHADPKTTRRYIDRSQIPQVLPKRKPRKWWQVWGTASA